MGTLCTNTNAKMKNLFSEGPVSHTMCYIIIRGRRCCYWCGGCCCCLSIVVCSIQFEQNYTLFSAQIFTSIWLRLKHIKNTNIIATRRFMFDLILQWSRRLCGQIHIIDIAPTQPTQFIHTTKHEFCVYCTEFKCAVFVDVRCCCSGCHWFYYYCWWCAKRMWFFWECCSTLFQLEFPFCVEFKLNSAKIH